MVSLAIVLCNQHLLYLVWYVKAKNLTEGNVLFEYIPYVMLCYIQLHCHISSHYYSMLC